MGDLPDGLSAGVIPPDGTQLALSVWLRILSIAEEDAGAFVKQLNKDRIPHPKFCGTMFIDSTHIRRVINRGRSQD